MRLLALRGLIPLTVVVLLLPACSDSAGDGAQTTLSPATSTTTTADIVATTATATTVESTTTIAAAVPDQWVLAERGTFGVGRTSYEATNPHDNERPLQVDAYYPAVTAGFLVEPDAAPDASEGPYPVIIGVDNLALFAPHLASHGFVVLAVQTQAPTEEVDTPLELSSALDALEELSGQPLGGLGDTDRTGVMGYSGESLFALMLAGTRIDPDHWAATCDSPPEEWGEQFEKMVCVESRPIVAESAQAVGITTEGGLWGSLRDSRIKASMPMGPRGFYLTGPEGLATGEVPILMLVGSEDTERAMETASILEHYPTGLASAITLVGTDHMLVYDPDAFAQIQGFALAFFSYQLKGDDEYAQYLTREFVEEVAPLGERVTFDALVWGVPTP